MAKALCFGSLNIDYIYQVPHFVGAGETLSALSRQRLAGGKGLNQAVALSRAGAQAYMAGSVGEDGEFLLETLQGAGVDISFVRQLPGNTGTAVIQRDGAGENCILLHGGANRCITADQVQETLEHFAPGDWLVLQNEISCLPLLLEEGRKRGMQVVFNPSPMERSCWGYVWKRYIAWCSTRWKGVSCWGEKHGRKRLCAVGWKSGSRGIPWCSPWAAGGPGACIRGNGCSRRPFPYGSGHHRSRGCFHRLFRGQPHDGAEHPTGIGEGRLGRCPDHPTPRQCGGRTAKLTLPWLGGAAACSL